MWHVVKLSVTVVVSFRRDSDKGIQRFLFPNVRLPSSVVLAPAQLGHIHLLLVGATEVLMISSEWILPSNPSVGFLWPFREDFLQPGARVLRRTAGGCA